MQIRMMDGTKIDVTDEEARMVAKAANDGTRLVGVKGCIINTTAISGIYSDETARADLKSGRLHDGTRVRMRFGRWTDEDRPDLILSTAHYPEIGRGEIMSDEEWEREIRELPTDEERKERYREIMARRKAEAKRIADGS